MAKRDYYDVLGVKRDASAEEIKRAYRKLAREHHPDVSKAPDAQKKFTEIQEAYATLSDETKRAQYDRFGHAAAGAGGPQWRPTGGSSHVEFDTEDLGSVFDAFFGGGESFGGFGQGRRSKARPRPAPSREVERDLDVDFEMAARGGKKSVRIAHDGTSRSIDVTIPKGVGDGTKLRVRNAFGGEPRTDLILRVKIEKHALFKRDGLDLLLDLPLTVAEATFGAKVAVPTLDRPVELSVPPGTSGGTRLRLKGRGIEDSTGRRGDLYAEVRILAPDVSSLSDEDREALRRVGASQGEIRQGPGWPAPGASAKSSEN
jgi:DnaJ-class molecular chaperone